MLLRICLVIILLGFVNSTDIKNFQYFGKEVRTSEDQGLVLTRDGVCEPQKVRDISFTMYTDTITVEWTSPQTCVTGFIVFLDDDRTEISYDSTTVWYSKVYENLLPCIVYHIGVSVIGEDGTVGSPEDIHFKILSQWPSEVSNIAYEVLNNSLVITWDSAESDIGCVTDYNVFIWDRDFNTVANATTQDPTYKITPYVPCAYYGISITPFIYSTPGNSTIGEITSPAKVNEPPAIVSIELGWYLNWLTAKIVLSLEPFDINACEILSTHVECSTYSTSSGIVSSYEDSPLRPDQVMNLFFSTRNRTYTCYALVTNSEGDSELSESFIIITD